jgi:hypothetical protein
MASAVLIQHAMVGRFQRAKSEEDSILVFIAHRSESLRDSSGRHKTKVLQNDQPFCRCAELSFVKENTSEYGSFVAPDGLDGSSNVTSPSGEHS